MFLSPINRLCHLVSGVANPERFALECEINRGYVETNRLAYSP